MKSDPIFGRRRDKWLESKCSEIEELDLKHDSFNLHKKVKEFTNTGRKFTIGKLFNNNNELLVDIDDQKKEWETYISTLF